MRSSGETSAKILLVAGPSGAGKSTLIDALGAGRLAASPLPKTASTWPSVTCKDVGKGGVAQPCANGGTGLIVHYDTMRVLSYGYSDYEDDPAIKFIERAEVPVIAVTVAPPREMLFAQYLERAVIRNDGTAPGTFAPLKRGLRHLHRRAFGPPRVSLSRMQVAYLAIYGSDPKLAQWNARWEAFLDRLADARGGVHRLIAKPEADSDGAPSFRISAEAPAPLEAVPLEAAPLEAAPLEAEPLEAEPLRASA